MILIVQNSTLVPPLIQKGSIFHSTFVHIEYSLTTTDLAKVLKSYLVEAKSGGGV